MERWSDIEGFDGLYQVSSNGKIKSLVYGKERIMKLSKDSKGYVQVCIGKVGTRKPYLVHRLVAQAFIHNPENKREINHKDLDKTNNHDWNLEWNTRSENIIHSIKNGHHYIPKGEQQPGAKINDDTARLIKIEIANGKMPLEISKKLDVPYNIVKDIKRGRTWRHVTVD